MFYSYNYIIFTSKDVIKILSTQEIIKKLKEKGIIFFECSETNAEKFLNENNYFIKLTA